MAEQLALSGKGSKVLEVDLPRGNYRLSWSAQGSDDGGYQFYIALEAERSQHMVIEYIDQSGSGEAFARLPGGRHVFSVQASHLMWEMSFTQL